MMGELSVVKSCQIQDKMRRGTPSRNKTGAICYFGAVHDQWRRMAMGLFLFGISFGYVEAAVVVYIRTIYEPIRLQVHSKQAAADLFPMMTLEQLRATAPETVRLVGVEVVREIATLLMISGVALAAAGGWKLWL